MKKFEYRIEKYLSVDKLNELGDEGWELVSVLSNPNNLIAFLKREMTEGVLQQRKKKKSEFLDTPLIEFYDKGCISTRTFRILRIAGIDTPRQLLKTHRSDLLKYRNFGKKSLNELDCLLEDNGFCFGQDISEYEEVQHD